MERGPAAGIGRLIELQDELNAREAVMTPAERGRHARAALLHMARVEHELSYLFSPEELWSDEAPT